MLDRIHERQAEIKEKEYWEQLKAVIIEHHLSFLSVTQIRQIIHNQFPNLPVLVTSAKNNLFNQCLTPSKSTPSSLTLQTILSI